MSELDQLERHEFVRGDIRDPSLVDSLIGTADVVVNFAAESHVDRSIASPDVFLSTNVVGAGVLLEAGGRHVVPRFVHVSTDEVYGPIDEGAVAEVARLNPSSPYAASKAAADLLVAAYGRTYGYQAIIARCTNNYGPYQHPEKLIPLAITRLLEGGQVPLYGDGGSSGTGSGWRTTALRFSSWSMRASPARSTTSVPMPGHAIRTSPNLAGIVGDGSIDHVADRPGHDRRYALDSSKLRALGWVSTIVSRRVSSGQSLGTATVVIGGNLWSTRCEGGSPRAGGHPGSRDPGRHRRGCSRHRSQRPEIGCS